MALQNVAYIYHENLRKECDKLPTMKFRATRVQDLINSFQLLHNENVKVYKPVEATENDLKQFHSSYYIDFLKKVNDLDLDTATDLKEAEEFGLTYDCPILPKLYDFASIIGGATLTAAKILIETDNKFVINWFGGWHHAQRDEADGFCYVNDIVLGIQKLLEKFERVLYVDLDVHHGNGVENAYFFSKKVLTLSFHKLSPGFYPGTGNLENVGTGNGKYFSINVPLLDGICNSSYQQIFKLIFPKIYQSFQPLAIVVQCGADILSGDPIGECNVTLETMGNCVKEILDCNLPTIFLGGGGYNFQNAAKYWTYLTSIIINKELAEDEDIPEDSFFFTEYVPTYELKIDSGNIRDYNTPSHIDKLTETIKNYCDSIETIIKEIR